MTVDSKHKTTDPNVLDQFDSNLRPNNTFEKDHIKVIETSKVEIKTIK